MGRRDGAKRCRCTAMSCASRSVDATASAARTPPTPGAAHCPETGAKPWPGAVWAVPPAARPLGRRAPRPPPNAAPISMFSAAPNGLVTVYTALLSCLIGLGVTAFFTVRTGCIARRTERGVAFRTALRTSRRPNPTSSSSPTRPPPRQHKDLDGSATDTAGVAAHRAGMLATGMSRYPRHCTRETGRPDLVGRHKVAARLAISVAR